ncbi:MAG: recombination mediator RecR [Candidatus Dependentiae bacterium]|nr:recombination mediator RecR [Candidatus Dependentiae bacterium]
MIDKLPTLVQLLKNLQQVPFLASKNIYRVASHFLHMDNARAEQFCAIILEAKRKLTQCVTCFSWQEKDRDCLFCAAIKRDQRVVCVVETWQELLAIEKTGGYNGVFHVLGGVICPLEGVGPEDLTIVPLVKRVDSGVTEIILALNQTPEGEATAAYIASKLKGMPVVISCLARGLPVGSSLDAMDRLTVYKALSERRPF